MLPVWPELDFPGPSCTVVVITYFYVILSQETMSLLRTSDFSNMVFDTE